MGIFCKSRESESDDPGPNSKTLHKRIPFASPPVTPEGLSTRGQ